MILLKEEVVVLKYVVMLMSVIMDEIIEEVILFIVPRGPITWNSEAVGFVFTGCSGSFDGFYKQFTCIGAFLPHFDYSAIDYHTF